MVEPADDEAWIGVALFDVGQQGGEISGHSRSRLIALGRLLAKQSLDDSVKSTGYGRTRHRKGGHRHAEVLAEVTDPWSAKRRFGGDALEQQDPRA